MKCTCKSPYVCSEEGCHDPKCCYVCGKPISTPTEGWEETRKNLLARVEKNPALALDIIDAAYLAGLEARKAPATEGSMEERFFQDNTGEKVSGWLAMTTNILNKGDYKIATPDDVNEVITQEKERSYEEGKKFQRELHRTWLPAARKNYEEGVQAGRNEAVEYMMNFSSKVIDPSSFRRVLESARTPKP